MYRLTQYLFILCLFSLNLMAFSIVDISHKDDVSLLEKSSIYFPIPLGGSNINPIYLDINLIKDVPSDAIIIYVFDKNKILVKSFKPKKGKL